MSLRSSVRGLVRPKHTKHTCPTAEGAVGGTGFEEDLGERVEEQEVMGNEVEEEDLQDLFNDEPVPSPVTPPVPAPAIPPQDGEHEDPEMEEQCEPRKGLPDPGQPTQQQVDDHNLDHFPYRCWCRACVEGRGRGEPHRAGHGESQGVSMFAFDYLFITAGDKVKLKAELSEDDEVVVKALVAKDSQSRAVFAHVVPKKGIDEDNYAVDVLVEDLKWLGHSHVVLRTDNEPAIVALLKQAMITLRQDSSEVKQVVEEHSSRYDSQSNGFIEATLRDVQGLVRTYTCALSQRIGQRIPPDHAIFSWLVEHAAWIMTTRRVGHDGRTAYARVRRHTFTKRGVEFGEKVLYKLPMKGPEADARGSMDPRYKLGIVLGFSKNSPDYWVYGDGQVRQYRSIQRRPSDDRWSAQMVAAVNVTPHDLHTKRPAQALGAPAPREGVTEGAVRRPYRMLLKKQDFIDFGYTADCKRCRHSLRYGYGKTKMPHSEACRVRIEEELKSTLR